jgi:trehalose/maltose transport system substrate-binding protein
LTGSQVQLRRALHSGYLPTVAALYEAPELSKALPHAEALKNIGLQNWVTRPSAVAGDKYAGVSQAYSRTVHDVLSGRVGAEEALPGLEKQLVALTGFSVGKPR